ncbi:MAG: type III-A CRISPR-associated RAMP protein Csm5 [Caldicoprobacterales bacterium]
MKYGHLELVKVKLKTLTPVYIGSGESLTKKEYIFDRQRKLIYIPDLGKLTGFLAQRTMLKAYERYLLQPRNNDLYYFLYENKVGKSDYNKFTLYTLDASEIINQDKFRGILTFVKGADGLPYIPGSSLKGAIRTAIAAKLLQKGNYEINISNIEKAVSNVNKEDFRYYTNREARNLECGLFNKLDLKDPKYPDRIKWYNSVNDCMRGIQISDSKSIDFKHLTICGKYDRKPDGNTNVLPIYRECLIPGTTTEFYMTLDKPVLSKWSIDLDYIQDALDVFMDLYHGKFSSYFRDRREDTENIQLNGNLILGGGAGYATKTISYPLIQNRDRALDLVQKIMIKEFPKHKHEKDTAVHKVSPHTLKTTVYKGRYYGMGKCHITFA